MNDPSDDEIAAWAASLSPEGSPGKVAQIMREYLGDSRYEKFIEQNDEAASLHLSRQTMINGLLTMLLLFSMVGLVGFIAILIKFLF
jgi:hypothetical protein